MVAAGIESFQYKINKIIKMAIEMCHSVRFLKAPNGNNLQVFKFLCLS